MSQLPAVSPERTGADDDPRHRSKLRPTVYLLPPLPTHEGPSARRALKLHLLPVIAGAVLAVLFALVIKSAL